ncbi:MAG TPA: alkaline phosphatase family protein [Candidatus Binataceae bacterium]|nr:alkaline phosphatase family protein [Candidatus Binataceae bacterium]
MHKLRRRKLVTAIALGAMLSSQIGAPLAFASAGSNDGVTATPIKHVILIIGENRTFDHVFGTFKPVAGQTVHNLLSEGVVRPDGSEGPNYKDAQQFQANDTTTYSISPDKTTAFATLPQPNVGGPATPLFASVAAAEAVEPALPLFAYNLLTIGGTGITSGVLDTRFPANLPNSPFDITDFISYDDYAGSPVHRFFQMWQQLDCDISVATPANPSGCQADLFPWVERTVATGSNGNPEPAGFVGEGAISMGYYNNLQGDVSYFNQLAHQYALSDNYHQAIMGGTGANHIAIGYGDAMFYAGSTGQPSTPPSNQIENPNPQSGTNNFYTQDGYGGGSYVDCADDTQPGIAAVTAYLAALPYTPWRHGNCAKDAYYLVNNYNPGYLGNGTPAPLGSTQFTIPPSKQRNLGLLLNAHNISWHYYGEGWASGAETGENSTYCNICNPFLYSTQIMTNPVQRANLKGIRDLYADLKAGTLPAVSIVKPDGYLDGHPASSKFELFEEFSRKIIGMVKANPALWQDTAIMITVDEGGGYYDSGYVQPIDFFGDGTRIPLLVVSPYSTGGKVVHTYYDHVSFAKFVEANWGIETISDRSRDNLPNPIATGSNPYVPLNGPAIGDLMEMFNFSQSGE